MAIRKNLSAENNRFISIGFNIQRLISLFLFADYDLKDPNILSLSDNESTLLLTRWTAGRVTEPQAHFEVDTKSKEPTRALQ
ncbi:putative baseplate hub protein [Frankliniella fusca]|uniref:Baseplate hub protein n=1 Tax=Frankliniella fusca TaxID=407009 RepID=A0AAE1HM53_9NEOP|nr:putative baseplate hub protein [Frankliniella fusca]